MLLKSSIKGHYKQGIKAAHTAGAALIGDFKSLG